MSVALYTGRSSGGPEGVVAARLREADDAAVPIASSRPEASA